MAEEHRSANSRRITRLADKFKNKKYRDGYVGAHTRRFLAHQMRALRGDTSQTEFGKLLDKPQSVVSRLEDPDYGKWTMQTLLEVAASLNRAAIVRIVDFHTFLRFTEDMSETALCPVVFDESQIAVAVVGANLPNAEVRAGGSDHPIRTPEVRAADLLRIPQITLRTQDDINKWDSGVVEAKVATELSGHSHMASASARHAWHSGEVHVN